MKRILTILTAVAMMMLVSATAAMANTPVSEEDDVLLAHSAINEGSYVLLEVVTDSQRTQMALFESAKIVDSGTTIVFKNGFTATDDLWHWRKNIEDGVPDKRSGTITVLDQDLSTVISQFNFYEGWPSKSFVVDQGHLSYWRYGRHSRRNAGLLPPASLDLGRFQ